MEASSARAEKSTRAVRPLYMDGWLRLYEIIGFPPSR